MLNGSTYIVRPRMQPLKSSFSFLRISNGFTQLFVGPALSFESEQMNVRSSTRATSLGVGARVVTTGPEFLVQLDEGAARDHLAHRAIVLFLRAIHPMNRGGRRQLRHFFDPPQQVLVLAQRLR